MQREPCALHRAITAKDSAPDGEGGLSSNRRRRLRPGWGRYAIGAWAYLGWFRPDGPVLAGTCAVRVPMYEAHRSWQLPGQCRATIIMSAARNRIRHSPALLLACAGPSLRLAVTAHFAAAFTTQDAAAIPWSALPALQCPQRSSRRSASCGYWRCAPGRFHAMPVAQSVLGGLRCVAHQQADSRQPVRRQTSPCDLPTSGTRPQIRASPRRRSRPRHCARCRSGCVPATRRALLGDAAAAAAARRPARPLLICLGIAQARRQAHRPR